MDTEGHTPLSELLNDEPSEVIDVADDPQPDPEPASQPRDENGRFAKKGEEESASPAPVEEPAFDHAAVKGERSRRQAAEQERDTLRADIEALKSQLQSLQQPKEPEAPPPSLWEDEQGWQQHFGGQIAQQASFNARLDMSEMLASQAHEDFDHIKAKFLEMAQGNPALAQQALQAKHPWEKAYQIAKNAATAAELGATNIAELEAKLREQIMAEMQAQQPARPGIPPSLSGERSMGARSGPAWAGPTPLSELLR